MKQALKLGFTLALYAAVSCFALAIVNNFTAPVIEQHAKETGSERAKAILADWDSYKHNFKKIIPNDYLRIMTEIAAEEKSGKPYDDAVLDAFRKCTA